MQKLENSYLYFPDCDPAATSENIGEIKMEPLLQQPMFHIYSGISMTIKTIQPGKQVVLAAGDDFSAPLTSFYPHSWGHNLH